MRYAIYQIPYFAPRSAQALRVAALDSQDHVAFNHLLKRQHYARVGTIEADGLADAVAVENFDRIEREQPTINSITPGDMIHEQLSGDLYLVEYGGFTLFKRNWKALP